MYIYSFYISSFPSLLQVIQWLWKCVEEMTGEDRIKLLQFCTGCSRVPHKGFSHLVSAGGRGNFVVTYMPYHNDDELPTASTWWAMPNLNSQTHFAQHNNTSFFSINMLKLPDYPTYECLCQKLLLAIRCGNQGYAKTWSHSNFWLSIVNI